MALCAFLCWMQYLSPVMGMSARRTDATSASFRPLRSKFKTRLQDRMQTHVQQIINYAGGSDTVDMKVNVTLSKGKSTSECVLK